MNRAQLRLLAVLLVLGWLAVLPAVSQAESPVIWERTFEWSPLAMTVAADGTSYVYDGRGLYAIAPDGQLRWVSWMERKSTIYFPQVTEIKGRIVVRGIAAVACFDKQGKLLWASRTSLEPWTPSMGKVADFVVHDYPRKYAFTVDGELVWTNAGGLHEAARGEFGLPTGDLFLFTQGFSGKIVALYRSGIPAWEVDTGYEGSSGGVLGPNGLLYFVAWNSDKARRNQLSGETLAITSTGEIVWRRPGKFLSSQHWPKVVDGRLLVQQYDMAAEKQIDVLSLSGELEHNFTFYDQQVHDTLEGGPWGWQADQEHLRTRTYELPKWMFGDRRDENTRMQIFVLSPEGSKVVGDYYLGEWPIYVDGVRGKAYIRNSNKGHILRAVQLDM